MTAVRAAAGDDEVGGVNTFPAPPRLRLVPLEPEAPSLELLEWLASALEARLASRVSIDERLAARGSWFSEERSQLSSNAIVDSLIERFPGREGDSTPGEWYVGVSEADLRGGDRDYVFGEAARGGDWAVVSTARLGAPGEPEFRHRLLTETLHELGHLAGLGHCDDERCLMAASAKVADVDRKRPELCGICRSIVAGDGT